MNRRHQINRQGFTLMEIVIAVAIVAILAAAITPMTMKHLKDAKIQKTIQTIDVLELACAQYQTDVGAYAYEYSGYDDRYHLLFKNHGAVNAWNGPYIDHYLSPKDNPFGSACYVYGGLTNAGNASGFDITNADSTTHTGAGNMVYFDGVPQDAAKAIDESIDAGLSGDWTQKGRVKYNPSNRVMWVFLYQ